MKRSLIVMTAIAATCLAGVGTAHAQAQVGQTAPQFSAVDTAGKAVSLAEFKGKYVVLEWTNPDCPFVQKHYNSGKAVYAGAIDSKASANPGDIASATNYVTQAIDETTAGKPVSQPVTPAYGCSVKYASAG